MSANTNRYHLSSDDDDSDVIKAGLKWLFSGNGETLVIYVPTIRQVDGGTHFTKVLGETYSKQLKKDWRLTIDGITIHLITSKKMTHKPSPVRVLAIWADSDSLQKIEKHYQVSNLLVIPWNPATDIESWKQRHNPTALDWEAL